MAQATNESLRPLVPVDMIGTLGRRHFPRALLDTGSVDTIFPAGVAKLNLGANLHDRGNQVSAFWWRGSRMAKTEQPDRPGAESLLDAIAEIVHQGMGQMLDVSELITAFDGWKPNCSANYEYVFAWNPDFDVDSLQINWKRPNSRILRLVVKGPVRLKKILQGARLTANEKQAYRLELARTNYGYMSAEDCLESGTNCKWVDLSFVTDSKGRDVYILEMGDAASNKDEDIESVIGRHDEIWHWKSQPLTAFGPFASSDEAERWMSDNGAFDDDD